MIGQSDQNSKVLQRQIMSVELQPEKTLDTAMAFLVRSSSPKWQRFLSGNDYIAEVVRLSEKDSILEQGIWSKMSTTAQSLSHVLACCS